LSFGSGGDRAKTALIATLTSLVAIIIIIKFTNASISWNTIAQIDGKYLLLGVVLHVLSWIFYSIRLRSLAALAGHEISFELSLRSTLASNFMACITPSSAGGEPLRIKILADDGMSYGSATAVAVGERLLDSIFFVAALALFLMLSGFLTGFGLKIGMVFLVLLMLLLTFLWEVVKRPDRIERLMRWAKRRTGKARAIAFLEKEVLLFREAGIQLAKEARQRIPLMLALTTLIWMSDFMVPSALLVGMGSKPSFLYSITAQIILAIIGLLPLTPGGSGVAELSMSYLYSIFVPIQLLGPLVALWRIITYFLNIIVGVAFAGASINGMRNKNNRSK
jgi:uncharacterized protein (TIRG00374 family)